MGSPMFSLGYPCLVGDARMFWRNAYRTWLLQLAQMSDHEAARKIRVIVEPELT
jgi:hypothetical protein